MVEAIAELKELGITRIGITGAYHMGRIAPLMAHAHPGFLLRFDGDFPGSVLPVRFTLISMVTKRVRDALVAPNLEDPICGQSEDASWQRLHQSGKFCCLFLSWLFEVHRSPVLGFLYPSLFP